MSVKPCTLLTLLLLAPYGLTSTEMEVSRSTTFTHSHSNRAIIVADYHTERVG